MIDEITSKVPELNTEIKMEINTFSVDISKRIDTNNYTDDKKNDEIDIGKRLSVGDTLSDDVVSREETNKNEVVKDNNNVNDVEQKVDNMKNCPIDNGEWEGDRGDSKWIPDEEFVPQKSNPDNKNWKEILDEYDTDGIVFSDGDPDFKEIAKAEIVIDNFSANRSDNFDSADREYAKETGQSPEEVAKWRQDNKYTWHECKDMKTMQLVPSIIHGNVSHRGGIAEAKGAN